MYSIDRDYAVENTRHKIASQYIVQTERNVDSDSFDKTHQISLSHNNCKMYAY